MKCYVCGSSIGKTEEYCPCCRECVVDIIGDNEETEKILRDKGEKRRNKLLVQYEIFAVVYKWDGKPQEVRIPLGSAAELYHVEKWLDERFARIPEVDVMDMKLAIMKNGSENDITFQVESFQAPTFLHIGAVVEDGFRLRLMLKNDQGEVHRSEAVALLTI